MKQFLESFNENPLDMKIDFNLRIVKSISNSVKKCHLNCDNIDKRVSGGKFSHDLTKKKYSRCGNFVGGW
jgi:hypothetical protein